MRLTITKRNYWLLKTMMETYRSNATSRLGCPSTPFPDTHISPSIAYIQLVISLGLLSLSLLDLDLFSLGRQHPLFGLGWNLLDGPFIGKRRRTRSQFELVQPTCHVLQGQHTHLCYSLVVGLAPLGSSLGWKDLFSLTRVAWGSV
jgi:hypothetical protein